MNYLIFDLDLTLIDTKDLVISGGPEPKPGTPEHDVWRETVTDPERLKRAGSIMEVMRVLFMLDYYTYENPYSNVRILTNRRESLRDVTQTWLDTHSLGHLPLLMRPNDCITRSGEFKSGVVKSFIQPGDTVTFFDDDPDGTLEQACRENGWTHLKVTTYR